MAGSSQNFQCEESVILTELARQQSGTSGVLTRQQSGTSGVLTRQRSGTSEVRPDEHPVGISDPVTNQEFVPLLYTEWVPLGTISRKRYLSTLAGVLVLVSCTFLLFKYVNKAQEEGNTPCFVIRINDDGRNDPSLCYLGPILLESSAGLLFFLGALFLQNIVEIRSFSWVQPGNWFTSSALLLFSLILSNFPLFIGPNTSFGFWVSLAYHFYFWMAETALAVRTDTNLHSTFASMNLSSACALLILTHSHWKRWLRPALVLFISGVLHLVSYEVIKRHSSSLQLPEPNSGPENSLGIRKIIVRRCVWILSIPLFLMCCYLHKAFLSLQGVFNRIQNCFNATLHF